MNLSDLVIVVAISSWVYAVVAAVAGRGRFLENAVNPYRLAWLLAAFSVAWAGIGLLRLEAGSWSFQTWGRILSHLVTDEPAPPRVKMASLALLLGVVFLVLVAWCWVRLPRDPSTFRLPEDRKTAFRYYVTHLRGGLDYAQLSSGDGERLEEAADMKQMARRCPHLPKVNGPDDEKPRIRTPDHQIELWRAMADRIHKRMAELDALIEPAKQGGNRRIVFDTEFGGIFFRYLRLPDSRGKVDTSLYLFGATLSQSEINTGEAQHHFYLLLRALNHIDRAIRVG